MPQYSPTKQNTTQHNTPWPHWTTTTMMTTHLPPWCCMVMTNGSILIMVWRWWLGSVTSMDPNSKQALLFTGFSGLFTVSVQYNYKYSTKENIAQNWQHERKYGVRFKGHKHSSLNVTAYLGARQQFVRCPYLKKSMLARQQQFFVRFSSHHF